MVPAIVVWAAAEAAHRINGSYFKEDRYDDNGLVARSNKKMVQEYLSLYQKDLGEFEKIVSDADFEKAREDRTYIRSWIMGQLSGSLNEFQKTALKLSSIEEFSIDDRYSINTVACLPRSAEIDRFQQRLKKEEKSSQPLPLREKDTFQGTATVLNSRYSNYYQVYIVEAKVEEKYMIRFSNKRDFLTGQQISIRGKVREFRDNVTVLNRVYVDLSDRN